MWLITSYSSSYFCQKNISVQTCAFFNRIKHDAIYERKRPDCMKQFVKCFGVKKHENALTSRNDLKSFKYLNSIGDTSFLDTSQVPKHNASCSPAYSF